MGSVVAAFSAAWIIHFIYLVTIGSRERQLRKSIESLANSIEHGHR